MSSYQLQRLETQCFLGCADEHFEAAGDAMDIHFDLRPERLRAAQTPVQEPERNRTALEAQLAQGPMFGEFFLFEPLQGIRS